MAKELGPEITGVKTDDYTVITRRIYSGEGRRVRVFPFNPRSEPTAGLPETQRSYERARTPIALKPPTVK